MKQAPQAALKLLALATALSGFFVCTQVWAEPVRFGVATEPFPPFTKKDDSGHWVGFEMDLLVAICARMKAQCVVVETPWKGIIPALNAGKFDIIWSSMTITPHRQEAIDFSDRYYWLPIVVVGPRSLSVTIDFSNPDSVRGRSIGTLAPSYNFLFLQKAFGTVPILVPCHLTLDCINELNAGHI